jgi:hypothetical protein
MVEELDQFHSLFELDTLGLIGAEGDVEDSRGHIDAGDQSTREHKLKLMTAEYFLTDQYLMMINIVAHTSVVFDAHARSYRFRCDS